MQLRVPEHLHQAVRAHMREDARALEGVGAYMIDMLYEMMELRQKYGRNIVEGVLLKFTQET